jgi:enoyl-CoA hydratase/carnithine racemase
MADAALQLQVREDGIAVLTINQPGSRANVLNHALWNELKSTLTAIQTRTDLRGLIVASAKPGIFIAGADLKFFQNIPASNDPSVREFVELGLSTLEILESLPFPTCAAIDGADRIRDVNLACPR